MDVGEHTCCGDIRRDRLSASQPRPQMKIQTQEEVVFQPLSVAGVGNRFKVTYVMQ